MFKLVLMAAQGQPKALRTASEEVELTHFVFYTPKPAQFPHPPSPPFFSLTHLVMASKPKPKGKKKANTKPKPRKGFGLNPSGNPVDSQLALQIDRPETPLDEHPPHVQHHHQQFMDPPSSSSYTHPYQEHFANQQPANPSLSSYTHPYHQQQFMNQQPANHSSSQGFLPSSYDAASSYPQLYSQQPMYFPPSTSNYLPQQPSTNTNYISPQFPPNSSRQASSSLLLAQSYATQPSYAPYVLQPNAASSSGAQTVQPPVPPSVQGLTSVESSAGPIRGSQAHLAG
ncbi:hypothetical protein SERLA73DRAFT_77437 [Serpula lacrymans var. lacrymans S7.3]|uniref:Uncharacterized protein n=1 Tax=Serpula lacrymans var. lacrymans (strain S7.3) TaxID=936435 RepID=F8QA97_SERL3|nr:hypothetical protein SERLA73DRAFT_77437 [Serpula lacrymans var. lacrymans S7.3]